MRETPPAVQGVKDQSKDEGQEETKELLRADHQKGWTGTVLSSSTNLNTNRSGSPRGEKAMEQTGEKISNFISPCVPTFMR